MGSAKLLICEILSSKHFLPQMAQIATDQY
jgi:hypothetical protein